METKMSKRERGTGRYTYTLNRACVCGHTLGEHTATRAAGMQPCCETGCKCESFKPARKGL